MASKIFLVLLGLILSLGIHIFPVYVTLANDSLVQTPVQDLMQQGKSLYQKGQFADAARNLKQLARAYQLQGDLVNQALALNYVSLTQQKLGDWNSASEAITTSLNILNKLNLNSRDSKHVLALTFNTQGSLQLALGQTEKAIESWQKAVNIYTEINDDTGRIGSLINKANAYQALGFYRRSESELKLVEKDLLSSSNSLLKAAGLRSLGNMLQAKGEFVQSQKMLEQGLIVAQQLQSSPEESTTLLSLGNLHFANAKRKLPQNNGSDENSTPLHCNATTTIPDNAKKDYAQSIDFYQKSINKSTSEITKVQAQLNSLNALQEFGQQPVQSEVAAIKSEIASLTPSRAAVYAKVKFARNLVCTDRINSVSTPPPEVIELLNGAIQQSQELKDMRAESFATGNLGQVYEKLKQYDLAQQYTGSALRLAQLINAPDITYQWQWQLGRLHNAQRNFSGAVAAYQNAFTTLKSIRNDLASLNTEAQFDFRDEVEPVYRQLVSLLLSQDTAQGKNNQNNLTQARDVIEALQLAELDNFFRDACNIVQQTPIDQVVDNANPATAVFYPIILPDRISVIVKLPQRKDLLHYTTDISKSQVENEIEKFRDKLQQRYTRGDRNELALEVYNWIIKGAEKDLELSKVKNLVFVLDGSLRNIPMAALYDGKHYLIEKYSVALSPGLRLIQPKAKKRRFEALAGGLTKSVQGFSALTNVENEINKIKSVFPSTSLLNQAFTDTTIEQKVSSDTYGVVHLATHGKFSSQLGETFILAWNGKININELRNMLQSREQILGNSYNVPNPIELLVLSACETAVGDKRAALGLAGVAVRSGARSTLASLWQVDDQSTAVLMGKFYEELAKNPDITKSEALRRAQQYILEQKGHPFYWAPYVLVGNWL
ncbi:hypothetical protein NIES4071_25650 [Calothrix sp. NIES-4071]|nr:hypothetical protein NIES4071_25650 [Calothrix sp. NIES-4071]BAZ56888.1 hypothetical protein NIES4105_25590 [Calothrix sp. NIES-4105]